LVSETNKNGYKQLDPGCHIAGGVSYGTPLFLAGIGELLSERGGLVNLGIEGMMLIGASVGFWVSQVLTFESAASLLVAFAIAMIAGALAAGLYAVITVGLRADQVVTGLILAIFGGSTGLSTYLGSTAHLIGVVGHHNLVAVGLGPLSSLPVVGPVLFHQDPLVYASWFLLLVVEIFLGYTRLGRITLKAVGDNPTSAAAMGIKVRQVRFLFCIAGGALAGLGGAYYSLRLIPSWSNGLTAGAGWIALGLVIVAFWRPILLLAGCYLFGISVSIGSVLAARGITLAPELYGVLPYALTLIVLIASSALLKGKRWASAPASLGKPYEGE